jgi:DNA primase catalytic core
MQVSPDDLRPTGPVHLQKAARRWQQHLDTALAEANTPAVQEWGPVIGVAGRSASSDPFLPVLAERLAAISRTRINAAHLLHTAINTGPVPDEHGAAALWWRISRHLRPAVTVSTDHDTSVTAPWAERLTELVGADRAHHLQHSRLWPALVTVVDHALRRGWPLEQLLSPATAHPVDDECQALVWWASLLTGPLPDQEPTYPPLADPSFDLEPRTSQPAGRQTQATAEPTRAGEAGTDRGRQSTAEGEDRWVEADLAVASMVRTAGLRLEQSDADVKRMMNRADAWRDSPVPRDRLVAVNQLALEFFQSQFPGSWGQDYLRERMGVDLAGDPRFGPGQATAGWTRLVDHLHRRGVTDQEMLTAGIATRARTGRLIDRFRDRIIFPITNPNGEVLGFTGRRHPDHNDTPLNGPKYLNTAETPLYYKGAQLFSAQDLSPGQVPVIVEGPIDAIAVTIAGAGRYVGVAPLGASLTDEQATQLARFGIDPIVATDADAAGQVAAERAFWHLTPHGLHPRYATWPTGTDPADVLTRNGPDTLLAALDQAQALADTMIDARLAHLTPPQARAEAIRIIAAQPPDRWDAGSNQIANRLKVPTEQIRRELLTAVQSWNHDPQATARDQLTNINAAKTKVSVGPTPPEQPWETLAAELDPRLLHQTDWPATAALLQAGHNHGHDIAAAARAIVSNAPLGALPAQDLRYRLLAHLDIPLHEPPPQPPKPSTPGDKLKTPAHQINPTPTPTRGR